MAPVQALAAIFMALGVACGAFGAHALRDAVPPSDLLIWEKAVLYQLIHSLAALVIASSSGLALSARLRTTLATVFLVSVCVFSGSLYILVLGNLRWLGMITPLGGTGFIAGWLILAFQLVKGQKAPLK